MNSTRVIVFVDTPPTEIQSELIKAFEKLGYQPMISASKRCYDLNGVSGIVYCNDNMFYKTTDDFDGKDILCLIYYNHNLTDKELEAVTDYYSINMPIFNSAKTSKTLKKRINFEHLETTGIFEPPPLILPISKPTPVPECFIRDPPSYSLWE